MGVIAPALCIRSALITSRRDEVTKFATADTEFICVLCIMSNRCTSPVLLKAIRPVQTLRQANRGKERSRWHTAGTFTQIALDFTLKEEDREEKDRSSRTFAMVAGDVVKVPVQTLFFGAL